MRPGKYVSLLITILASAIAISLPFRSDAADGISPSQRAEVSWTPSLVTETVY